MSVLLLAIGTTRARAVCGYGRFLADKGVPVSLVTTSPGPWAKEGLDERVAVLPLETSADRRLLATKPVDKFYKLVRPYTMWRRARRKVLGGLDLAAVEQVVVCDSHAIPIAWHLARRYPDLTVGFELDRTPYLDAPSLDAPTLDATAPSETVNTL